MLLIIDATLFCSKLKVFKFSDYYKITKLEVAKLVHNFIYNNLSFFFPDTFLKHFNIPIVQRDFLLMKTNYLKNSI